MTIPENVVCAGIRTTRPTYVYDLTVLRRQCSRFVGLPLRHKSVYFATMANDHPLIVKEIQRCGLGVFVNSMGHLELAMSAGFDPSRIVFASSNMIQEEMEKCVELGVHVILDSLAQLRNLGKLAHHNREIGIRVNVGCALSGSKLCTDRLYRFGLLPSEIPRALEMARGAKLKIVGVHAYLGTDLLDPGILLTGLERLAHVATLLPDVRYLDTAGGFGVADDLLRPSFDLEAFATAAAELLEKHEMRLGREIELKLEPGRFLTAQCGFFFVKVVDVKLRDDLAFVGTTGSVAIFPRPLIYPERAVHPCVLLSDREDKRAYNVPIYVCGNSTYSRDFLARDVTMPLPEPGEAIAFYNAGAYCRSMITQFLCKEMPLEIVMDSHEEGYEPSKETTLHSAG